MPLPGIPRVGHRPRGPGCSTAQPGSGCGLGGCAAPPGPLAAVITHRGSVATLRCNAGSVGGVPLSVDGQVLLVHNRTRPRPYRPQGLAIDSWGRASQQRHGPGYDPGTNGDRSRGRSAFRCRCCPARPRPGRPGSPWPTRTSGPATRTAGVSIANHRLSGHLTGRTPMILGHVRVVRVVAAESPGRSLREALRVSRLAGSDPACPLGVRSHGLHRR